MSILSPNISNELETEVEESMEHLNEVVDKGAERIRWMLAIFERGQSLCMDRYAYVEHKLTIVFTVKTKNESVYDRDTMYKYEFRTHNGETYESIRDRLLKVSKHLVEARRLTYKDLISITLLNTLNQQ